MTAAASRARLLALLLDILTTRSAEFGSGIAGDAAEHIFDALDAAAIHGTDAERAAIYDLVNRFFSRFARNGVFSSTQHVLNASRPKRNGGTVFSWTGRGRHYTKLPRFAASQVFRAGTVLVRFEITRAEPGIRGRKPFLVLAPGKDAVRYSRTMQTLVVSFERRRLAPAGISGIGFLRTQEVLNRQIEGRILAAVPDAASASLAAVKRGRSLLARRLARFAAPRQADCFIHRDLAGSLSADLDSFLLHECLDLDLAVDILERRLRHGRAARVVALAAIDLIARVEETKRLLFEKKKFVIRAGYCVTLDRVPAALYPEILANPDQRKAWESLHGIDCTEMDAAFLHAHPFLMVDTGLFPRSFADRLLASFGDLDASIQGLVVHSESWQALRLLGKRYHGSVHCCYVDPPYNTGGSSLGYDDRYSEGAWLTLIEERLELCREFLCDEGLFFASIGDAEEENLKRLVKEIFGDPHFLATIVWQRSYAPINLKKFFSEMQEYILVSAKAKGRARIIPLPRSERQKADYKNPDMDPRGPWKVGNLTVGPVVEEQVYPITTPSGRMVLPPKGYCWRYTKERFRELLGEDRIWFGADGNHAPTPKCFLAEVKDGVTPVTLWTYRDAGHYQASMRELRDLFGDALFVNPKPLALMDRIFRISIESSGMVLDPFAGSGSTAHALINLNRSDGGDRRYVMIEGDGSFAAVIRKRIQKACYASAWKDGRPLAFDGISHAFKYLDLEQYEDALENLDDQAGRKPDPEGPCVPIRYASNGSSSQVQIGIEVFDRPFDCSFRSVGGGTLHEEPVDLVETFNCLLGLTVRRVRACAANGSRYCVVHGSSRPGERTTVIWRTTAGLDLAADRRFIEEQILADTDYAAERVFINGAFRVDGAMEIAPVFLRLMND